MTEPKKTAPPVKCRVCDEPFATEGQIARVRKKTKITQELAETCPRCRAAESRRVMVEELIGTGNSP